MSNTKYKLTKLQIAPSNSRETLLNASSELAQNSNTIAVLLKKIAWDIESVAETIRKADEFLGDLYSGVETLT